MAIEPVLVDLAAELQRYLAPQARAEGIRWSALAALSDLHAYGALSQSELAHRLSVRPATISLLVRELKAGGLVAEYADPGDARRRRLEITEAGRRRLDTDRERLAAPLSALVAGLDPADRAALAAALPGLLRALAG